MSGEEFAALRERAQTGYAAAKVEAGEWAEADALRLAREQTDALLSQGVDTPGMLLLSFEDERGEVVGSVWVALESPNGPGAWIYDIEVSEAARGKGYGRLMLAAVERAVRERGVTELGLNVFAGNAVARGLYESSGYKATSVHMRKQL
ncbi:MAG TPA: GNAT family N-acetyltransferase [Solirubrobacteraceae bacterium]|jgi:ribosomal protein S18 acetylase RimI-like enzyme